MGGTAFPPSALTPDACSLEVDPSGLSGYLNINLPKSVFSPTRLAYSAGLGPRPAVLTGMDELVVAGSCHLMAEEQVE